MIAWPGYNHTRGDSPLNPCPECAAKAKIAKAAAHDRLRELVEKGIRENLLHSPKAADHLSITDLVTDIVFELERIDAP
jgi:hypothetical protein